MVFKMALMFLLYLSCRIFDAKCLALDTSSQTALRPGVLTCILSS